MVLEQAIIQLLILTFMQLVLVTIFAVILVIALIVIVSKNSKKNASLLDR